MEEHKTTQAVICNLWHRCQAVVLLCLLVPAAFASQKIELLLSSNQAYYQQTASHIQTSVQQQYPAAKFTITVAGQPRQPGTDNNSAIVVAVGSNACKAALVNTASTPLLCTFLPRSNYRNLVKTLSENNPSIASKQHSAIYFDQPLSRYMALIKLITPAAKHLGTAVGPQSSQLLPEIEKLAGKQQLQLHHTLLRDNKNPLSALTIVVEQSEVFLINPDKANLNKTVARWLLRLCIRQRIPVIAYSKNYVNAGALAAVYSSPENIGRDTGESINRWLGKGSQSLQAPRYPRYFTVSSNLHVARALSIKLPENQQLQTDIEQMLDSSSTKSRNDE